MHPRLAYYFSQWKPRALQRAKSLEGRPLTPYESEVADRETDNGVDYFMAFGIQPETQKYIDYTIQVLEEENEKYMGQLVTTKVRLEWSCKDVYNQIIN